MDLITTPSKQQWRGVNNKPPSIKGQICPEVRWRVLKPRALVARRRGRAKFESCTVCHLETYSRLLAKGVCSVGTPPIWAAGGEKMALFGPWARGASPSVAPQARPKIGLLGPFIAAFERPPFNLCATWHSAVRSCNYSHGVELARCLHGIF